MKQDILILSTVTPAEQEVLEQTYEAHRYDQAEDKESFLSSVADKIKGVVTSGGKGITRELVEKLPNLEIVSSSGVGYDPIDIPACNEHGVKVTNTPDVLTDDVADLAIALMLASKRRIVEGDGYVRRGDWSAKGSMRFGSSIKGKNVGIAGLGRIGKAVAARLEPMKAEIGYWGRTKQDDIAYPFMADLLELAKWSDTLIAVMPGGASTAGIINRDVLEALGPTGTLVNIARGSVVDEPELIAALKDGRLGSAALDVFLNEPNIDPAFYELENVVLHPHNGSATFETRAAMSQLVLDNLAAHFAGKPLLTPVN